jgi:inositol-1,3,4-trisphosphate 5/6-kinase
MLSRFVEEHPDFRIMDPFKNIYPLLDRLQIQKILVRLQELGTEGKPKLRAPYSCKVILIWMPFQPLVPF